jgi:hypothetical protein
MTEPISPPPLGGPARWQSSPPITLHPLHTRGLALGFEPIALWPYTPPIFSGAIPLRHGANPLKIPLMQLVLVQVPSGQHGWFKYQLNFSPLAQKKILIQVVKKRFWVNDSKISYFLACPETF